MLIDKECKLIFYLTCRTSANKLSLNLDYLPFLRKFLTAPLVLKENDGIAEVIDLMDKYDIIKEDFDNILEVTKWPNSNDPMSLLSSKVSLNCGQKCCI